MENFMINSLIESCFKKARTNFIHIFLHLVDFMVSYWVNIPVPWVMGLATQLAPKRFGLFHLKVWNVAGNMTRCSWNDECHLLTRNQHQQTTRNLFKYKETHLTSFHVQKTYHVMHTLKVSFYDGLPQSIRIYLSIQQVHSKKIIDPFHSNTTGRYHSIPIIILCVH